MRSKRLDNPFYQLATLIDAGLNPAKAVAQLNQTTFNWQHAHRAVSRGEALSKALFDAKIIQNFDGLILQIGETSGRLPHALMELAQQYDQRATMVQGIRSKLLLPFAVFIIAIIVSTILSALRTEAPLFILTVLALLQLIIPIFILKKIFAFLMTDSANQLKALERFKNFSFYQDYFQHTVFSAIAWQIESGIDIKRAWLNIIQLLPSNVFRSKIMTVASQCEQGQSMAKALRESNLPINRMWIQIISSAEASGTLVMSLKHQLRLQKDQINARFDIFTEWLPRFVYALVAAKAVGVILLS